MRKLRQMLSALVPAAAVGMVTALGTTSLVTATAAGMVVSAATVLAVPLYAGAVWALSRHQWWRLTALA